MKLNEIEEEPAVITYYVYNKRYKNNRTLKFNEQIGQIQIKCIRWISWYSVEQIVLPLKRVKVIKFIGKMENLQ